MKSSNSYGTEHNLEEYPIGYTDVIEKFQDGSYIHYQYSSWTNTPDDLDVTTTEEGIITSWSTAAPKAKYPPEFKYMPFTNIVQKRNYNYYQLLDKFGLYTANDMSRFRGKLLNKSTYSSTGSLVYQETNTYNIDQAKSQYQFSIASVSIGCVANKIYSVPCRVTQHELKKSNVSALRTYKYNDYNLISEEQYTDSKGTQHLRKSKYICDYGYPPNSNTPDLMLFKSMIDKHMIGYLSEEQTLIMKLGSWNLLKGRIIKYGFWGNNNELIKPKEEYILEINQPLTSYTTSELSSTGILTFDSNYKRRTIYDYNVYGNLLCTIENDVDYTAYLWGYNRQHPIAEIKNAPYSLVRDELGGGDQTVADRISSDAVLSASDSIKINNLRTFGIFQSNLILTHFAATRSQNSVNQQSQF